MLLTLILSGILTFVELNCENLFDTHHDSLRQDAEFLPEGVRHWTKTKYWSKLNKIGQTILSCADQQPDLVALCEVENDTVLHDLTRRSLLREAGYEYLMTESADRRGIDVALLYHPASFRPLCYEYIEVPPCRGMRPTRDILYVKGVTNVLDTLHVFVLHAPSRYGGERKSRPFRMQVVNTLLKTAQGIKGNMIIAGDFNDYATSPSLRQMEKNGFLNATKKAVGIGGKAKGTYRYRGEWHSLDHIVLSPDLAEKIERFFVNDASFLLEEEQVYGGYRPRRSFQGFQYRKDGFSDHLPLVIRFTTR
jgi:endonuclease/exonuclease/phosphatase family metal-dependent hydrolase